MINHVFSLGVGVILKVHAVLPRLLLLSSLAKFKTKVLIYPIWNAGYKLEFGELLTKTQVRKGLTGRIMLQRDF